MSELLQQLLNQLGSVATFAYLSARQWSYAAGVVSLLYAALWTFLGGHILNAMSSHKDYVVKNGDGWDSEDEGLWLTLRLLLTSLFCLMVTLCVANAIYKFVAPDFAAFEALVRMLHQLK